MTERRRLRDQLLSVQEEERRRLGQEFHDSVASQMTGIAMILSSYETQLEAGDNLTPADIRRVKQMVQEGEAETRRLSRGLHPGDLGENTLSDALDDLAKSIGDRFPERCVCEVEELPDLGQQTALHLYRIVQEAVTNALRHAEPDMIHIGCQLGCEELMLTVEDDGRGFDREETDEGLGLSSMRYRARAIGAEFEVDSAKEKGTTIRCRLPLY